MFKSYLLIACRNLLRHRVFSIINISGLAFGMAACLLIQTKEILQTKMQPIILCIC